MIWFISYQIFIIYFTSFFLLMCFLCTCVGLYISCHEYITNISSPGKMWCHCKATWFTATIHSYRFLLAYKEEWGEWPRYWWTDWVLDWPFTLYWSGAFFLIMTSCVNEDKAYGISKLGYHCNVWFIWE